MLARFATGALFLLTFLASAGADAQAAMPLPQVWTGRMQVPEGVEPGLTADQFELKIFGLTTDSEIQELAGALRTGGQVAVRNKMFQMQPRGWVRIGRLAATEVVLIRALDLPDGRRRVRVFSDQPLRLYDKHDPAGSDAHPFGFLELVVDASGAGSGSLLAAASLQIDGDGLRLDTAGTPVVPVIDVHTDSPPAAPGH